VFKVYFKEMNFLDLSKNREIMRTFIKLFEDINYEANSKHKNQGFFAIPLHRIFSYYFTRLIMKNYLLKEKNET
jgi:hypothetical protein